MKMKMKMKMKIVLATPAVSPKNRRHSRT